MDTSRELKCVPAATDDANALMELQFAASDGDEFHRAIWGNDTVENRYAAAARLLKKWQANPTTLHVMKCLDSSTGNMVAFCIWEIVSAKRSREEALEEDSMNNCDWLEGQERKIARAYLIDALEEQWNVMQGAPHAHLTNLCTRPEARKRGAASALVKWGVQLANSLEIPAYCETSDMSHKLYQKLGFREVSIVRSMLDGELFCTCPVVVKSPEKTITV